MGSGAGLSRAPTERRWKPPARAAVTDIRPPDKRSPPPAPHPVSPCKYRLPGTNKAFCRAASPSASASALSIVRGNLRDR